MIDDNATSMHVPKEGRLSNCQDGPGLNDLKDLQDINV